MWPLDMHLPATSLRELQLTVVIVDEMMSAAQLYVAMSRGREENRCLVVTSDLTGEEPSSDHVQQPEVDALQLLTTVLSRHSSDRSAHEVMRTNIDRHEDLSLLRAFADEARKTINKQAVPDRRYEIATHRVAQTQKAVSEVTMFETEQGPGGQWLEDHRGEVQWWRSLDAELSPRTEAQSRSQKVVISNDAKYAPSELVTSKKSSRSPCSTSKIEEGQNCAPELIPEHLVEHWPAQWAEHCPEQWSPTTPPQSGPIVGR